MVPWLVSLAPHARDAKPMLNAEGQRLGAVLRETVHGREHWHAAVLRAFRWVSLFPGPGERKPTPLDVLEAWARFEAEGPRVVVTLGETVSRAVLASARGASAVKREPFDMIVAELDGGEPFVVVPVPTSATAWDAPKAARVIERARQIAAGVV